ncbi:MAG: HigA family addiction module antidote protein [Gammaproteobacteria bacterium]|jgi:addiction module HigA family antidote|nr:HigA family addiction module antidote protein [Gammaproteobacteria bacterium]
MSIKREALREIDFSEVVDPRGAAIPPTSPADILLHEYMEPLGLSANALAGALRVPANRITNILKGRRSNTVDTALRLARCLGTTPPYWMNLQSGYDLEVTMAEKDAAIAGEISRRVTAP